MKYGGSIAFDSRSEVSFFDSSFWACFGVFSDVLGVEWWWILKECCSKLLFGCLIGFSCGNVKLRFCFQGFWSAGWFLEEYWCATVDRWLHFIFYYHSRGIAGVHLWFICWLWFWWLDFLLALEVIFLWWPRFEPRTLHILCIVPTNWSKLTRTTLEVILKIRGVCINVVMIFLFDVPLRYNSFVL